MVGKPEPTALRTRVGHVINLILGAVAITPVLLAIAMITRYQSTAAWVTLITACIWLTLVFVHRGLAGAQGRRDRIELSRELAAARTARLESSAAFQDRLNDHNAILDRIVDICRHVVEEGIIDPQLTLDNVRLIESHARDAQSVIEEAILETRIETGSATTDLDAVNLRIEIEEIVSRFSSPGIFTSGPVHYAATDRPMFRVIVRSLIAAASARGAEEVDVAIASNEDMVVCTVSDNGAECDPKSESSPLAGAIARTLGTDIEYARRMNRNQFSFALPATNDPRQGLGTNLPLDVLGSRRFSRTAAQPEGRVDNPPRAKGKITFADPAASRETNSTVADRKRGELISG